MGKRKRMYELIEATLDRRRTLQGPVTFRVVSIDFEARRVTIDGQVYNVEEPVFEFPILSGDAVFMPSRSMDRFA